MRRLKRQGRFDSTLKKCIYHFFYIYNPVNLDFSNRRNLTSSFGNDRAKRRLGPARAVMLFKEGLSFLQLCAACFQCVFVVISVK